MPNPSNLKEATMASSVNQTTPTERIDMHIGSVFDAEKFLDLERRLFKVEPRPIPGTGVSEIQSAPENKIWSGFIRAATKVAYKLDDILRAPFEALSSLTNSDTRNERQTGVRKSPQVQKKPNATPPTSALKPKVVKPEGETHVGQRKIADISERSVREENVTQQKTSHVIKKGHVQRLIKKYEDVSDVTRGSSVKSSIEKNTLRKPAPVRTSTNSMKHPNPTVLHGNIKQHRPVPPKQGASMGVSKPEELDRAASKMQESKACRGLKSGERITFPGENNIVYIGGNRRSNDGDTSGSADNVRSGRKSPWSQFCGLHRVVNRRS